MSSPTPSSDMLEQQYPSGIKLLAIMSSLFTTMFLFSLDRTILGTALPAITTEFNSLGHVGWYSSVILLTSCCFTLLMGKIFTLFSIKWVYISVVLLFEVGSAICGAAPNSATLIMGRAITGVASAGIMSGAMVILSYSVPLRSIALYQGLFGAIFGLASVVGPLLGGVLTDKLSWRWCFYINLPFGAIAVVLLVCFLNLNVPKQPNIRTFREVFWKLDPIGTTCFVPGVVCLSLALNWGGDDYAWSSWRIVFLLVLAGILLPAFIMVQLRLDEDATLPPRLFKQRSVVSAVMFTFLVGPSLLIMTYYLPLWFQAVKGVTAVGSGFRVLALLLSVVAGSFLSGGATYIFGYYAPAMIASSVLTSIGAGVISTWVVHTPAGVWVGDQILFGFGLGLGLQQPNLAIQAILPKKDVAIAASLIFFSQGVGGSIFLSVAKTVFANAIRINMMDLPDSYYLGDIIHGSVTQLREHTPDEQLDVVLDAFNDAISKTFYVTVALSCLSTLPSLMMEWKSVRSDEDSEKEDTVAVDLSLLGTRN